MLKSDGVKYTRPVATNTDLNTLRSDNGGIGHKELPESASKQELSLPHCQRKIVEVRWGEIHSASCNKYSWLNLNTVQGDNGGIGHKELQKSASKPGSSLSLPEENLLPYLKLKYRSQTGRVKYPMKKYIIPKEIWSWLQIFKLFLEKKTLCKILCQRKRATLKVSPSLVGKNISLSCPESFYLSAHPWVSFWNKDPDVKIWMNKDCTIEIISEMTVLKL